MEFKVAGHVSIRDTVNFHANDREVIKARVEHLWPMMGGPDTPPGVNLDNGETSVPHKSHVPQATGYYWTHPEI